MKTNTNKAKNRIEENELTPDEQLIENLMCRAPYNPNEKSGDMKYPGYDGIWGEFLVSEGRWTPNRFYVSAIRGYEKTDRMSFAKAWMIRCLRMGKL